MFVLLHLLILLLALLTAIEKAAIMKVARLAVEATTSKMARQLAYTRRSQFL